MRLSDRTWAITLEPWDIDLSEAFAPDETARPQSPTTFSMATLGKAFDFHGEPLQDADATKLSEVIGCCREHGAPLSPLTQRMMRDYVAVASRLMGTGEAEGEHVAVDYALSQKVVPQIQAANTPRKTELIEALGRIDALPRSAAALDALG